MLGYSKDELEGVELARLTHPDNVKDDAHLYEELMAGERAFYRIEGRYLRKDGEPIHVNLTVSMVRPARDRPRFAIALVEDVTEQKRTQAALIVAEKLALAGRLAASLAHEINNPMQSVIGYLSLVQEMLPESAGAHEYVEIALEELERAAGIVARMRDLGRPSDAGEYQPVGEREPVDVNVLVERVLLLTQKRCQNQRIEVQWEAAEDLPLLYLAPGRIQQVFLNLVLNAVDAMAADIPKSDRRRLRVYTAHARESQEVQIVFADNGVGIPPDEQASLFEPFHTTKEAGLGLGLYISQSIVQDHGGHISVESQEGIGTTFTVWLPGQGTPG
jgi:PAS domain S-box-containing protein